MAKTTARCDVLGIRISLINLINTILAIRETSGPLRYSSGLLWKQSDTQTWYIKINCINRLSLIIKSTVRTCLVIHCQSFTMRFYINKYIYTKLFNWFFLISVSFKENDHTTNELVTKHELAHPTQMHQMHIRRKCVKLVTYYKIDKLAMIQCLMYRPLVDETNVSDIHKNLFHDNLFVIYNCFWAI